MHFLLTPVYTILIIKENSHSFLSPERNLSNAEKKNLSQAFRLEKHQKSGMSLDKGRPADWKNIYYRKIWAGALWFLYLSEFLRASRIQGNLSGLSGSTGNL